jgi:Tol biopolymer transport system component
MSYPNWAPQGNALTMEVLKRDGPGDYRPIDMRIIDLANNGQAALIKHLAVKPKWAPDGNNIVFADNKDIYSVDMKTGKITNLTNGNGKNRAPSWAPLAK